MASSYLIEQRRQLIADAEETYEALGTIPRNELYSQMAEIQEILNSGNVVQKASAYLKKEERMEKIRDIQKMMKKAVFFYDDLLQKADKEYKEILTEYNKDCQNIMDSMYEWLKPELIEWLEKDFDKWKKTTYIEDGDIFSRRSWNYNVLAGHVETSTGTGDMFLFGIHGIRGFETIGQQTGAAIAIAEYMQSVIQEKFPMYQVTYMQNDNKVYFNL